MADIRPFRGWRYNPTKVSDLSQVITQPYDKISKELQQTYLARNPSSFVHLILPAAAEPYSHSAATCRQWSDQGILIRDNRPTIYVLHQDFEVGGQKKTRKSFVAAIRADEFEKGTVLPHERTLSKPKADRLNLLRATRMDYEQIFMLYSDPEGIVEQALSPCGAPAMLATDDYGVVQKVWPITDPAKLAAVHRALSDKVMLIADGHHRYETALNFRQEMEQAGPVADDAALRFKSTAFVNIADPGLVILPTHRLLYGLGDVNWNDTLARIAKLFETKPIEDAAVEAELSRAGTEHVFALHTGKDKTWLLRLTDKAAVGRLVKDRSADFRDLDVVILHTLLIEHVFGIRPDNIEEHVAYERNPSETLAKVDSSKYQAALLINPTRADQVQKVAAHGERMPQKSTDFYPKFVSGLVFMDIGDNERV
ncbi:MAG: DUF1015 domain-containing protein [candidate division WOR-3 bacterium]|nr:DUF1015 domain-containing protein [candidate division WOR-3 bacterium]